MGKSRYTLFTRLAVSRGEQCAVEALCLIRTPSQGIRMQNAFPTGRPRLQPCSAFRRYLLPQTHCNKEGLAIGFAIWVPTQSACLPARKRAFLHRRGHLGGMVQLSACIERTRLSQHNHFHFLFSATLPNRVAHWRHTCPSPVPGVTRTLPSSGRATAVCARHGTARRWHRPAQPKHQQDPVLSAKGRLPFSLQRPEISVLPTHASHLQLR